MNAIRQIIATSFLFHSTVPQVWTVKELMRVSKTLEDDEKFMALPPHRKVVESVMALLEINPKVPFRQVYGLTAVQLFKYGLLDQSIHMVCTVLKKIREEELDEVLSNNHRFFQIDSQYVDPLFEHYQNRGNEVYRIEAYRINGIASNIVEGLLSRVEGEHRNTTWEDGTNPSLSWFQTTVHRLARRTNLTPEWWKVKTRKGVRAKKAFEGYMRALMPRIVEESEEDWAFFLKKALIVEFPRWQGESIDNFIIRLTQEYGPSPPRSHYKPRRKIQEVIPNTEILHPSGFA